MNNKTGKVTKEADGFRVRFERTLNHDIKTVWDAITDPDKLKLWFTDIEMEFKPGGKLTIIFRDEAKTRSYGEIVTIEPPNKFAWTWEGELAVWELLPLGKGQCKLTFTYSRLSDEYGVNAPAGFHTFLDRLEKMLQGQIEYYAFGAEENDPEHLRVKALYAREVTKNYPELKRFEPITLEKTYNAPVEKVWQAITDKNQMKEWYFDLSEFKAEVGFEFQFFGQGHKGEQYLHLCKITEVVPLKKLQYSWRYDGYEGNSFVTFELFNKGKQTKVRLTHKGLHTFPSDNADFARESFNQGWNELIGKYLKEFVEKE